MITTNFLEESLVSPFTNRYLCLYISIYIPSPILLYSQYNSCGKYFGVLRISSLLDFVHHLIFKKHNLLEMDLLPSTGEVEEAYYSVCYNRKSCS